MACWKRQEQIAFSIYGGIHTTLVGTSKPICLILRSY
jgi:hypothetical protein